MYRRWSNTIHANMKCCGEVGYDRYRCCRSGHLSSWDGGFRAPSITHGEKATFGCRRRRTRPRHKPAVFDFARNIACILGVLFSAKRVTHAMAWALFVAFFALFLQWLLCMRPISPLGIFRSTHGVILSNGDIILDKCIVSVFCVFHMCHLIETNILLSRLVAQTTSGR